MTIWHFIISNVYMIGSVLIAVLTEYEKCVIEEKIGGGVSRSTSGAIIRKAFVIYICVSLLTAYLW